MPETLRVRRLGEQDAASIAELFRAAEWDRGATAEGICEMLRTAASENPFEPGKEPPTVGAFLGTRLVGFVTTIPTQFWIGEKYATAHWLKALLVLEEHRNGPIAMLLMRGILKQVDLAASMPASPMARQLSVALGMLDLGAVRDYIEPLRPTRILRKLDFRRFEHLRRLPRAISVAIEVAKIPPLAYAIGALISLGLTVLRLAERLGGATADDAARHEACIGDGA